ncbi:MAG: glycerol-3-phosphate responsive antiterminator [Eubacteriales bacterium]|nr:glycerol-3-phosphate responsive antiterminator [Eubacteriales bacterium]
MGKEFVEKIEGSPIIAAIKNDAELALCLTTDIEVIFILYGDLCTIPGIVEKIKEAGRVAMVHLDLVAGLAPKEASVDFIRCRTQADGIITTRANLTRYAKEKGLATVLRFFILDSMALSNIEKQAQLHYSAQPDVIEILPGVIVPKVMKRICAMSRVPVIAGGLIHDREDVVNMLDSGAVAISTSTPEVWLM